MFKTKGKPQAAKQPVSTNQTEKATHILAGKTVAFVGKFGHQDTQLALLEGWVCKRDGKIVEPAEGPDYLVVGEGRGGKPPADVAKVRKKHPTVQTLDIATFLQLVRPSSEELLENIRNKKLDDKAWQELDQTVRLSEASFDMRGTDFRGLDLNSARLTTIGLNGADFRCCKLQHAYLPPLVGTQFDDATAPHINLSEMEDCSFARAILLEAWMINSQSSRKFTRCDFHDSVLAGARSEGSVWTQCNFAKANLSDARFDYCSLVNCDFTKANLSRMHACNAKFVKGNFRNAILERADFRHSSFTNADFRDANLRGAILSHADLTGALVDGADFAGAVLTHANLDQIDFSKAKNFTAPVPRIPGPKLLEFAAAASGSAGFFTAAKVDLGAGDYAQLELRGDKHVYARSQYYRNNRTLYDQINASTFVEGMQNLAEHWPNATLLLDSIEAKGSRSVRGQKLGELAMAAWAEVFGIATDVSDLKDRQISQMKDTLLKRDQSIAALKANGSVAWNAMPSAERERLDLRGVDLSGCTLTGIQFWGRDLKGTCLTGASLAQAELWNAKLQNANLSNTDLSAANLSNANLEKANMHGAKLPRANLSRARLQGADFTNANLMDVNLEGAQFDEKTVFPEGFTPPEAMVWKGEGAHPGMKPVAIAQAGTLDFETFLQNLNEKVERSRMEKAGSMLKAEKFQLFAEVKDEAIVGVVKSQSSHDLVYSCRLASDGAFSCCTQNLRPCGGLRGALCKHLLVLIVGLGRAGQLDAATVNNWIELSRTHKPAIDEDIMTATFLRYKGAEAGEIDWRPTETIPEDFYAM